MEILIGKIQGRIPTTGGNHPRSRGVEWEGPVESNRGSPLPSRKSIKEIRRKADRGKGDPTK